MVHLHTENEENAGTSANVYVTLYGTNGDTGRRLLQSRDSVAPFVKGKVKAPVNTINLFTFRY